MNERMSEEELNDIRHYFLSDLSVNVPDEDIALIDKLFNHIESLEEENKYLLHKLGCLQAMDELNKKNVLIQEQKDGLLARTRR